MNSGMLECRHMNQSSIWMRWQTGTKRHDFCQRHNLSKLDQDLCIVCCAEMNIRELNTGLGHFVENIEWLREPLKELELDELWNKLEKKWRSYAIQK